MNSTKNMFMLTVLSVATFIVVGCMSPRQKSQNALSSQQEAQAGASRKAKAVSDKSQEAVKTRQISESADQSIQAYLEIQQDSIRMDSLALVAASDQLRDAGKKGNKSIPQAMADANYVMTESARRLRAFEEKTAVILDFLDSETFSKSEMNTLFPIGEYRLKPSQIRQGQKLFAPTVEKLFVFSEKYKGAFKSMQGEIVITGYSDATPVEPGSRLYNDLSARLIRDNQITQPTSTELNQKLSELRAEAVKAIVEGIIQDKANAGDFLNISVKMLGRGEEIPPFLTGHVSPDDKRRRIVTFYWVVLPTM